MKANPANPPSKDRPAPGSRRASRSFAPTSLTLEGRELLSTSDLTYLSLGAAFGSVTVTTTPVPMPPILSATSASPASPTAGGVESDPGPGPPPPTDSQPDGGQPPPPPPPPQPQHDRTKDRVGLAEASVSVNGMATPEFAFADPAQNVVLVKVGIEGAPTVLSAPEGINDPTAVVLKDVNGDGHPDLLVANTGGNNVLVFPGLPGGGVGPELNGGSGFAVGQAPTGITVSSLNNDANSDLIVANRGSDSVTVLMGQGSGANWTLIPGQTLAAGVSPVRTAVQDINLDGKPDLFILNSGSDDVTMYQGLGGGTFDPGSPTRFAVGVAPAEMFVGKFDHRSGVDLVTVNSGSNDVSFIAGINTSSPQSMTFTSGGTQPDAAFAVDLNHDGVLDLVVANGGDGRVALLQGGNVGLQLAGVITRADLPAPTGLAPDYATGAKLDFFAASAGLDAAQLLTFDLGPASAFLSVPLDSSSPSDGTESELIAQLLPFGESDLELIAVLWEGDRVSQTKTSEFEDRGASLSLVPYAKTVEENALDDLASLPANPSPIAVPPDDPSSWIRYVLGLDEALEEPRNLLVALAPLDHEAADPPPPSQPLPERPPADPDIEAATSAVDEALRSLRSEGQAPADPAPAAIPDRVGLGPVEPQPQPQESRALSIPLVASSLLLASRLIFKASTPRPPSIRRGTWRRLGATDPRGDRPTRL
jgi:FG-GAP-like repeat